MSARATGWVWHNSEASGNDRMVLLAIADECDHWGRNAFPGIDRLVTMTKVDRATVYRCLTRLRASGELLAESEGSAGRGKKTCYCLPKMPTEERSQFATDTAVKGRIKVANRSHGHAQNADTLTLTQIQNRDSKSKRTQAQIESDRRYGGEGARIPETTPDYIAATEAIAEPPGVQVPKVIRPAEAARARSLIRFTLEPE